MRIHFSLGKKVKQKERRLIEELMGKYCHASIGISPKFPTYSNSGIRLSVLKNIIAALQNLC